jgi:hypothetical protein
LNESDNKTLYVSHTPDFGLFAISHNTSDINKRGTPPRNRTKENVSEETKKNTSLTPTVLSESGRFGSGNALQQLVDMASEGVNTLTLEWIVIILFGVFVFVLILGIALRKQSMDQYKEDIISGTNHTLKLKDNVLLDQLLPEISTSARIRNVRNVDYTNNIVNVPIHGMKIQGVQNNMYIRPKTPTIFVRNQKEHFIPRNSTDVNINKK